MRSGADAARPPMTETEAHLIDALRQRTKPHLHGKPKLAFFCTDGCYLRYLRARSHDVTMAHDMLVKTLEWREKEGVHDVSWESVKDYARTGKIMRAPAKTHSKHPVLIMRPALENWFKGGDANVVHFVYHMEMSARYADTESPDGKIVWIIDYSSFGFKHVQPVRVSMAILNVLQHHYPERLKEAILWHPPYLFNALWAAISPFMDDVTRSKLTMLPSTDKDALKKLQARLDVRDLDATLGGSEKDSYRWDRYGSIMKAEEAAHQTEYQQFRQGLGTAQ